MTFGIFFFSYKSVSSKMKPYSLCEVLHPTIDFFEANLRQPCITNELEEYIDVI